MSLGARLGPKQTRRPVPWRSPRRRPPPKRGPSSCHLRPKIYVKLRPEAAVKGTTYKDVIESLVKSSTLADLDLAGQIRVRTTMAGARLFKLGIAHGDKADVLKDRMAALLQEVADVVRPIKTADLRVLELDDSASKATVEAVIAAVPLGRSKP